MKAKLFWLLALVGLALAFVGLQFSIPLTTSLTSLAIIGLGLIALTNGVEMIITRRADLPLQRRGARERYDGLPAQLWGVFFVVAGVFFTLLALAAWFLPGGVPALTDRLTRTPSGWGVILVGTGTLMTLYGIPRLLAGRAVVYRGVRSEKLDVFYYLGGAFSVLMGLGLAGLGGIFIVAPRAVSGLGQQFTALVRRWLIH